MDKNKSLLDFYNNVDSTSRNTDINKIAGDYTYENKYEKQEGTRISQYEKSARNKHFIIACVLLLCAVGLLMVTVKNKQATQGKVIVEIGMFAHAIYHLYKSIGTTVD